METAEVTCSDGWRLAVDVVAPEGARAVAVAGHAMMVDRRTLERLVGHLASRKIAVVWPDLRGHGRSGPRAGDGGRWSYDDLVEQDTPALLTFARGRFPELPSVVVGHSLFGHVALAHVARHREAPVDGLVLIASNLWGPRWEPDLRRRAQKRVLLEGMGALARTLGYFPARRLRIGNCDESSGFVQSMLRVAREGEWLADDGFSYGNALEQIRKPLLAIAAAGDRLLCRPESARLFLSRVAGAQHLIAGRASGIATDGSHMALVLDDRFRPVWERVADFILERRRS